MITRIEKVTIYVEDQAAAKKFWTEQVGFRVAFEQPMGPGMTWLEVAPSTPDATTLILYPKAAAMKQNPAMIQHPTMMFTTADVAATHAELAAKGVNVAPVEQMPWGKMFFFFDQDGQRFMVRG